jgi:hypothetical protein
MDQSMKIWVPDFMSLYIYFNAYYSIVKRNGCGNARHHDVVIHKRHQADSHWHSPFIQQLIHSKGKCTRLTLISLTIQIQMVAEQQTKISPE